MVMFPRVLLVATSVSPSSAPAPTEASGVVSPYATIKTPAMATATERILSRRSFSPRRKMENT